MICPLKDKDIMTGKKKWWKTAARVSRCLDSKPFACICVCCTLNKRISHLFLSCPVPSLYVSFLFYLHFLYCLFSCVFCFSFYFLSFLSIMFPVLFCLYFPFLLLFLLFTFIDLFLFFFLFTFSFLVSSCIFSCLPVLYLP